MIAIGRWGKGKYEKGSHFEKYKLTYSYQLSLAKFSVCLVSEAINAAL